MTGMKRRKVCASPKRQVIHTLIRMERRWDHMVSAIAGIPMLSQTLQLTIQKVSVTIILISSLTRQHKSSIINLSVPVVPFNIQKNNIVALVGRTVLIQAEPFEIQEPFRVMLAG